MQIVREQRYVMDFTENTVKSQFFGRNDLIYQKFQWLQKTFINIE